MRWGHAPLPAFSAAVVWASAAAAAGPSVRATVDRTDVALDEHIVLSVTIEGVQGGRPILPEIAAFEVTPRGSSQQVQIINGRMSASVIYTYLLLPKAAGTFTLGPVTVDAGGRTLASQPFTVRVRASAEPQPDSSDLFITATTSNRTPYVGEQVVYTLRVFRRVRVADARLEPPSFAGFSVQDLGQQRDYTAVVRGREYAVTEIRRALFAQRGGVVEIPAAVLQCQVVLSRGALDDDLAGSPFEGFMGRARSERKVVRSQPLKLDVRPLPPAPAGYSGLVGRFDIKAQVAKSALKVGESTTLSVTLSGAGNAQAMPEPSLSGLEGFKVYDDKPSANIDTSGNEVRGSKTFRKALVPLSAGEHTLPLLTLIYFDPAEQSYKTAHTAPLRLVVAPGESEEPRFTDFAAATGGKMAVQVLGDDILPNHTHLDALRNQAPTGFELAAWGASFAAPPALFFGLVVARRRSARAALTARLRRRRRALPKARAELRRALRALSRGHARDGAAQISRLVRGYIGDRLGMEGGALTGPDALAHLRGAGVSVEAAGRIAQVLAGCDAAHYGATTGVAGAEPYADVEAALVRLDREIRA